MGRVVGSLLAVLFLGLTLTGPASAKQVYLKDGGIIDCWSFKQVGGKVVVQVNRDIVVNLSPDEVDMKRTFTAKGVKKTKKQVKAKGKALAQPVAKPANTGVPPTAPSQAGAAVPTKPVPPAAKPGAPAAKPAVPAPAKPVPQSGKPAPPAPKPAGAASVGGPAAKPPVAAVAVKPAAPTAQAKPGTPAATAAPPAKPATTASPAQPVAPQPASAPANAAVPLPPKPEQKAPIPFRPTEPAPMPAAAALGAMMGTTVLLPLLILILICIVSFWKVFEKAGEAGWTCLIPIYNMFVLVKISGKPWWWFFLLFVPVVQIIFLILMHLALAERFGKSQLFGIGLCFFGFIFFPILAFDKSTYS